MATASDGWPLLPSLSGDKPPSAPLNRSYLQSLTPEVSRDTKPIPVKNITYVHGEPTIIWEEEEVNNMIIQEDLQYAVVEKFSYGWPEMEEIRKIVPLQCEMKEDCMIVFLRDWHILIWLKNMEDYVQVMSKPAYFLQAKNGFYQMRPLKWEPWFTPEEETTTSVAWISFLPYLLIFSSKNRFLPWQRQWESLYT
ncbi:hypothetical protein FXO38_34293 [Capsicum annuum]|nr:hypothetical protein FXO38_34293 [Capsicum annuum]KAF3666690.1 hypothetical protein FXO37_10401 [Capsicum annuum]